MFIPPFGDETIAIEPDPLSNKNERYNYFLKNAFSTKKISLHFFPCLPVCGVTRVLPNIFSA